jgi:hypothetical protein
VCWRQFKHTSAADKFSSTRGRTITHRESLAIYRVRKLADLRQVIIPFFRNYPLQTAKVHDFELFADVAERMGRGEHLTADGLQQIIDRKGRMRQAVVVGESGMESSETVRRALARVKIQSELHGDMQRPAETTGPSLGGLHADGV